MGVGRSGHQEQGESSRRGLGTERTMPVRRGEDWPPTVPASGQSSWLPGWCASVHGQACEGLHCKAMCVCVSLCVCACMHVRAPACIHSLLPRQGPSSPLAPEDVRLLVKVKA